MSSGPLSDPSDADEASFCCSACTAARATAGAGFLSSSGGHMAFTAFWCSGCTQSSTSRSRKRGSLFLNEK